MDNPHRAGPFLDPDLNREDTGLKVRVSQIQRRVRVTGYDSKQNIEKHL